MGLDDSKAFSESLRKELFPRLKSKWRPFCRPPLGQCSLPQGLAISLSLQLGLRGDFSEFSKLRGVIQV